MEKDYKKLREIAMAKATTKGYHQYAEDFGQQACLWLSQGRYDDMEYLWIDYLRMTLGDNRRMTEEEKRIKKNAQTEYYQIEESWDIPDELFISDTDFYLLISEFDERARTMLVLTHKWEFTLSEIAQVLGLHESRISQSLKEVYTIMNKRMKFKNNREHMDV